MSGCEIEDPFAPEPLSGSFYGQDGESQSGYGQHPTEYCGGEEREAYNKDGEHGEHGEDGEESDEVSSTTNIMPVRLTSSSSDLQVPLPWRIEDAAIAWMIIGLGARNLSNEETEKQYDQIYILSLEVENTKTAEEIYRKYRIRPIIITSEYLWRNLSMEMPLKDFRETQVGRFIIKFSASHPRRIAKSLREIRAMPSEQAVRALYNYNISEARAFLEEFQHMSFGDEQPTAERIKRGYRGKLIINLQYITSAYLDDLEKEYGCGIIPLSAHRLYAYLAAKHNVQSTESEFFASRYGQTIESYFETEAQLIYENVLGLHGGARTPENLKNLLDFTICHLGNESARIMVASFHSDAARKRQRTN